jgi:hypothetical protein
MRLLKHIAIALHVPHKSGQPHLSVAIVSALNLQCAEHLTAVRSLISVLDYNYPMLRQSGLYEHLATFTPSDARSATNVAGHINASQVPGPVVAAVLVTKPEVG